MVETGAGGQAKVDLTAIVGDLIPSADDTSELGSEEKKWAALWVAIALVTSITIGGIVNISTVDSWLFVNASTWINESLNVSGNITAQNITALENIFLKDNNRLFLDTSERFSLYYNSTLPWPVFESPATYYTLALASPDYPSLYFMELYNHGNAYEISYDIGDDWGFGGNYFIFYPDTGVVNGTLFLSTGADMILAIDAKKNRVGVGTHLPQNELNVIGDGNFTGNVSIGGDLFPEITLTSDIGSGASRWDWLYVRNISVENIDLSENLNIGENITAIDCIIFDSGGKICSGV